jgi:hypothetical protein
MQLKWLAGIAGGLVNVLLLGYVLYGVIAPQVIVLGRLVLYAVEAALAMAGGRPHLKATN